MYVVCVHLKGVIHSHTAIRWHNMWQTCNATAYMHMEEEEERERDTQDVCEFYCIASYMEIFKSNPV